MSVVLFTVIDLETAGLAPPASVIEIGWTKLWFDPDTKAVEIGLPHSKLFRPGEALSPENIAVHHLTPTMLEGYELCDEDAIRAILDEDRPKFLVAANAAFEMQWLTEEIVGANLDGKPPFWICTVKAAARLYPDADSHSNQATRYRLALDLPEELAMPTHRAGPDSYVTAHILGRFLSEGVRVRDMVQWTTEPRLMTKLGFGKHKGVPFTEAPADYLQWMCAQADMDADAKHWAHVELERRRVAA